MFKRLTDRLSSAASSVLTPSNNNEHSNNPRVQRLVAMGFDATAAANALQTTNGNVDRAAELLLLQNSSSDAPPTTTTAAAPAVRDDDDVTMQRVMQESIQMEQQRQQTNNKKSALSAKKSTAAAAASRARTAAVSKAADAAAARRATTTTAAAGGMVPPSQQQPPLRTKSGGLSTHHPAVKLIPALHDKTKEEQVLRCADRLKSSPAAVDTLYRALTAVQQHPEQIKYRTIDPTSTGYQTNLANAAGAQDLLRAMNYRPQQTHGGNNNNKKLVLDRAMVDPALLYLGISALEQTKSTPEYKQAKAKIVFDQTMRQIRQLADSSETEAIQRAAFLSKCPTEPAPGRGALLQVVLTPDETVRRRFDADDTLLDVLHWLGAHGTALYDKLLTSREWSLVDTNRYPATPMDCVANQHYTLQYIGCWPSGRLQVLPNSEEYWQKQNQINNGTTNTRVGSSRGLGWAPTDVVYQ